jgi:MFS transporter, ACS family, hexuronate transporter
MAEVNLAKPGDPETARASASVVERGFKLRGLRWWIAGLIFLATLINYIDRLTISVLGDAITRDLHLTNEQFGGIVFWFLLAYTISQGLSGKLYDKVGTRLGFAISIVVWSLAAMGHALAGGLVGLCIFRFFLGAGEAGNWPGAAKVIAEWFPIRERALGMAIFNSGAAIGSIVAIPLIVWLFSHVGWHATFLVTGSLGFIWLALWLLFYQTPDRHTWLSAGERTLIREGQVVPEEKGSTTVARRDLLTQDSTQLSSEPLRWRDLIRYRQVWAIVLARFLTDPIWWLYITWLPLYLSRARGFSLKEIGYFAWVPFVAADMGSLLGGWMSGFLIKRGWTVDRARKAVIVFAALLMPAGIFAALANNPMVALGLIAVVLFGFQVWINNVQTLPSDFFSDKAVASVAGLGGTGAGLGSMIFIYTTGWVVDHFSYVPILVAAGLLAPLGTLVLFLLAGPIKRVELKPARSS